MACRSRRGRGAPRGHRRGGESRVGGESQHKTPTRLDRGDGVLPPRHRCEGGGRNKTATQAKRRNGCNGPGALELRWALGARGALAPKDRERAAALLDDNEGRGLDAARRQISDELGQVLVKNWAVFLPATFINLAFLPNELRVLFLNAVFFFWVIYLSLTVNAKQESQA